MPEPTPARRHQLPDRHFRWRPVGVSRLEGLADGVSAIVLALLFLRVEPPADFGDLMMAMKSLLPFAATFAIVVYIWTEQWLFSRRYDLRDGPTRFLQQLLSFLLLVYADPLKFLFTLMTVSLRGGWDGAVLFFVYGVSGWLSACLGPLMAAHGLWQGRRLAAMTQAAG